MEISLSANGGTSPYTWSHTGGTLPPGVAVRGDLAPNWSLAGVATATGTYNFTLQVTDSAMATASQTFALTVVNFGMTDPDLPDAFVGQPYTYTLHSVNASGGTWAVSSGSLPDGLTLNTGTGQISGTPTTAGNPGFQIGLTYASVTVVRGFGINVSAVALLTPGTATPGVLPNATPNTFYTYTFGGSGGTAPYTFSGCCGLPSGLSVSSGGTISGTVPNNPGTYSFWVELKDAHDVAYSKDVALTILGTSLTMGASVQDAAVGTPSSQGFGLGGGVAPYTWSAQNLPPGMYLRTAGEMNNWMAPTGAQLAGAVPVEGIYTFTVSVTDSSPSPVTVSQSFMLKIGVLDDTNGLWGGTVGTPYSFTIRTVGGTASYTWLLYGSQLPAGLSLNTTTGAITGTPLESGNFGICYRTQDSAGATLTRCAGIPISPSAGITVQCFNHWNLWEHPPNQSWSFTFDASGAATYTWSVESGSSLPPGLSFVGGVLSGTPTTPGSYSFLIRVADSSNLANFSVRQFFMTVTSLAVTSNATLPWTNVGTSYSQMLTVSGGVAPYTWAVAPGSFLPPGLALTAGGVLSGTPTYVGNFNFSLTLTDSSTPPISITRWFQLSIYPPGAFPPLVINNGADFGTYSVGPVQLELSAWGGTGTYNWTLESGALPAGMALRADKPSWFSQEASAALSGVATTAGNYSFTLRVTSGAQSVTRAFTLKVANIIISAPDNLPNAFPGVPYSFTFGTNAPSPTWSVGPNTPLPSGLTLSSAGVLSGTPTQPGNFAIDLVVSNGTDAVGRRVWLNISLIRITSPLVLPIGTQNAAYSQQLTATGGTAPYTWESGCCWPNGISLSSSGLVSGTPDQPGSSDLWINVRDALNNTYNQGLLLNIVGVPPILPAFSREGGLPLMDDFTLGGNHSVSFGAWNGTAPYSWSAQNLPAGLSLRAGGTDSNVQPRSAELSGSANALGDFNITVSMADSSSPAITEARGYPLHVSELDMESANHGATRGVPYSSTLRAIGGTAPYTWTLIAGSLPAGLTLNPNTGLIAGTPLSQFRHDFAVRVTDAVGKHLVRTDYIHVSDPPGITVNIWTGSQLWDAYVGNFWSLTFGAGGAAAITWSVESGSTLPPGLNLTSGGVLSGTPTAIGKYSFLIRAADASNAANFSVRQFELTVSSLTITSSLGFPWTNVGASYSQTLTAAGGTAPYTWALASDSLLPPGLTLTSAGVLSGTPASAGQFSFSITLTDSSNPAQSITRGCGLPVYPAGGFPPLSIDVAANSTFSLGLREFELRASGGTGTYTWELVSGTLPPGIALRTDIPSWYWSTPSPGLLGVTTTTGTYNFTLKVTGGSQSLTRAFTWKIVNIHIQAPYRLPDAFVGAPYSFTFATQASNPVWSLQAGQSLPLGLTLSAEGLLSGTPTQPSDRNFNVQVTDGTDTVDQNVRLIVNAILVTPSMLPNATQGTAYSQQLTASGGTGTYNWWRDCCLPNGLSFSNTGLLSGTPTEAGTWTLWIHVNNSSGETYKAYTINVVGIPPALPSYNTSAVLDDFTLGGQRTLSFSGNNGTAPYNWSAQNLPPGLRLLTGGTFSWNVAPGQAEVAGLATALGDFNFTVNMADSSSPAITVTRSYPLHVSELELNYPANGTRGVAFTGGLYATGGTPLYSFALLTGTLPPGLTLNTSTGAITGTPLGDGNFSLVVRVTDANSKRLVRNVWLNIGEPAGTTVNFWSGPQLSDAWVNQSYGFQFNACCAAGLTWSVEAGSTLPPGLSFNAGVLSGTPTAAGYYSFFIRVADSSNAANFSVRQFLLTVTSLNITSNTGLPWTNVGAAYSQTLTASGGTPPYIWTVAPDSLLPPGLSLSSGGVLSGTPTSAGNYNFNIVLSDNSSPADSITRGFSLNIYAAGGFPSLTILTSADLGAYSTSPIQLELSAWGGTGAYTWSLESGTLPPGMALRPDPPYWFTAGSSALSGVATTPGTYNFTLRVTSGTQTATRAFSMKISSLIVTTPDQLPDAFLGAGYSFTFTSNAGSPVWSLAPNTSPPPGLTLSAAGLLSGTPTQAGNWTIDVVLADGANTVGRRVWLNVSALRVTSPLTLPNGSQNVPYSQQIAVTGGTPPYTWSSNCCWPNGITLSPSGLVSGTTNNVNTWDLWTHVSDSANNNYSPALALNVIGTAPGLPNIGALVIPDDFTLGGNRQLRFSTSSGTAPYTWSAQNLPGGLSLRSEATSGRSPRNADLIGAATALGDFNFTVSMTDSSSPTVTVTRPYTLHVSELDMDWPPNGTRGVPYPSALRAFGGTAPYTWTILSGALPSGLSLNTSTGVISGTPSGNNQFNFVVRVTDSAGKRLVRNIGINIGEPAGVTVNHWSGPDLGSPQVNQPWSFTFAAGGAAAFTWSVEAGSTLPAGLGLSLAGVLSGTPTAVGHYSFFIRVADSSNAVNFAVRQFTVTVTSLAITMNRSLPWTNVGAWYSQTLLASGGNPPYQWTLPADSLLPPGLGLSPSGVLSGTPTSAGSYYFSITVADNSNPTDSIRVNFNVMVYPTGGAPPLLISTGSALGTWSIGDVQSQLSATGGLGTYTWSLESESGTLPPGLKVRPDGPDWFNPPLSSGIIGVATTPGTYSFTLRVTSGAQSVTKAFTMKIVALTAKDLYSLPDAFVGVPYSYTFSNTGTAPVTWTVQPHTSLPPGLTLGGADGVLSGTPTQSGSLYVSVGMNDGVDTVYRSSSLYVSAVQITSPGLLAATQGTAFSQTFAASGGNPPYTWNAGCCLPGSVGISADGTLSGTPGSSGMWSFMVTATDSAQRSYSGYFTLMVASVPPSLPGITTGQSFNDLTLGVPTRVEFTPSGGTPPYTWTAANLPPGMSIRPGGVTNPFIWPGKGQVWGTPTALGTYGITVSMTDSSTPPITVTRNYTLKVVELDSDGPSGNGTRNVAYSSTVRALGGTGTYSWEKTSGTLPAGLSLNTGTGAITGTPLENGNFNFWMKITDGATKTLVRSMGINIGSATTTININDYTISRGTEGQAYSYQLGACCAPSFIWSLEGAATMPPGLTLSSSGLISGTAPAAGNYTFLVRATHGTDPANYGIRLLYLTVNPTNMVRFSTGGTLPWTNVGSTYSTTITGSGGTTPYSFSVAPDSALPPGLWLSSSGTISGTPTSAGSFNFNLVMTDSTVPANTATRNYRIDIYPVGGAPPLYLSFGPDLGRLYLGRITWQLAASGGIPLYTYAYAPGATQIAGMRVQSGPPFPTNFSSSTTGGFMGVLTTPGSYSTTIRVTDSVGTFIDKSVSFVVSPIVITSHNNLPRVVVSTAYGFNLTAAGGSGSYLWEVASGSTLPAGLTLSGSGFLSGTPTVSGSFSFTIKATDTNGEWSQYGFSLEVSPFSIDTNGVLPQGTANTAYSVALAASGGTASYSWSVTLNSLPNGLSLNSGTGVISGTPTGTWNSWITIRATDNTGKQTWKVFSLQIVSSSPPALSISTTSPLSDNTVGDSYSASFTAAGGTPPYTWSLDGSSTLPPGFSAVTSGETGYKDGPPGVYTIVGRTTTTGNYSFTLRVTDSASNTLTRTYTLNISPLYQQYGNLPLSGTLLVGTSYTQALLGIGGTQSYTWTATTALPTGLSLNSATGVVSGTPTVTGSVDTTVKFEDSAGAVYSRNVNFWISSGTAATLTITNSADLGTISGFASAGWTLYASGSPLETPNFVFSVASGSTLPPGFALLAGNAAVGSAPTGTRLAGVPLATGTYTFTLKVQDASGNLGFKTFTLRIAAALVVVPAYAGSSTLPDASVGVFYSQTVVGYGAASWFVNPGTTLPPGLTLGADGTLSGTPTMAGDYSVQLRITDASGLTVGPNLSLHISPLAITDPPFLAVQGHCGLSFSYTFTATGGSGIAWTVYTGSSLPAGLTLSPDGVLSGIPPYSGNYTFTLQATSGSAWVRRKFALAIPEQNPAPLSSSLATVLSDAIAGQAYSYTLGNNGGVPPYTWSVASGSSLPAGLSLRTGANIPPDWSPGSSGIIGVPATAGVYTFTLNLSDSAGHQTSRTFTLNVAAAVILPDAPHPATYNVPYTHVLTAVGGTPPYTFALAANNFLPPGLTLSSTGVISGTPTNVGNFTFTLKVTDSGGAYFSRSLTLSVNPTAGAMINITTGTYPSELMVGQGFYALLSMSRPDGQFFPYTFSLEPGSSLPPGLVFDTGSSVTHLGYQSFQVLIAGAPTQTGTFTFTIRVTDTGGGVGFKTFTYRVSPIQTLAYHSTTADVIAEVPYSWTQPVTGGTPPYTFAVAQGSFLPPGLSISSDGVVFGTTTTTGYFSVAFAVTDAAGFTMTRSIYFRVLAAGQNSPAGQYGTVPTDASLGVPYLYRLDSMLWGGVPPFTWSVPSGSTLPPGLGVIPGNSADGGAYLAGVPLTPGSYSYQLSATDAVGQTVLFNLTTPVSTLAMWPDPFPQGTVGVPYSFMFNVSGGVPPYSVNDYPNNGLPPGIIPADSEALPIPVAGTPTYPGKFVGTLVLSDNAGATLTKAYEIDVTSPLTPAPFLRITPGSLQLTYVRGYPAAPVPVNFSGGGTAMNITAAVKGIPGVSLAVASGTTPLGTNLVFDAVTLSALNVGTYMGVLSVNSPQSVNGAQAIPILLTIVNPPPCSYTLTPESSHMDTSGGSGSISITAGPTCGWTASTSDSWISVTSAPSGSGNGTVDFTVAPNQTTSQRTGTITVGGHAYTIVQFGLSCSYAISPVSVATSAAAGQGVVAVAASAPACAWTASTSDSWITLGGVTSGSGNGEVGFAIAANTTANPRTGTVTVAGQTFTVNQAGVACNMSLSSASADMTASGGPGSVSINLPAACAYTTVTGPNWITVTAGGSGVGSGVPAVLEYSVSPNSSIQPRSGFLMIGGNPFQVIQAGVPCSFTVTANNPIFASSGASGSVAVSANNAACGWVASSNANWVSITSGGSGSGSGTVNFNVTNNGTTSARSATLTVAGQTVLVNQGGTVCTYDLRSSDASVPASGGTGAARVLAPSVCGWTAVSNAPAWLTVQTASGSGAADVGFVALANTTASPRAGTLTVAGKTFTVAQAPAPCVYSLVPPTTPWTTTFAAPGGSGSFGFSTEATGCTPAVTSYSNWISVGFTFAGTSGTANYTVAPNALGSPRTGLIRVADQTFTITQTGAACAFSLNAYGASFNKAGGNGQVLSSASAEECSPVVGVSGPEITLGTLGLTGSIYTQPYAVADYQAVINWIRILRITISGQIFTIKQSSW